MNEIKIGRRFDVSLEEDFISFLGFELYFKVRFPYELIRSWRRKNPEIVPLIKFNTFGIFLLQSIK